MEDTYQVTWGFDVRLNTQRARTHVVDAPELCCLVVDSEIAKLNSEQDLRLFHPSVSEREYKRWDDLFAASWHSRPSGFSGVISPLKHASSNIAAIFQASASTFQLWPRACSPFLNSKNLCWN